MKKITLFILTLFSGIIFSQSIGIGTTTPNSSAILDISSTTKGVLLPRMTTTQRNAIVNPAPGLSIFNTEDRCIDTYTGQVWSKNCSMAVNGDYTIPAGGWRPRADFGGTARKGAVGFSSGTKGYIGTGNDGGYKKDFWEYDPNTNIWIQKADFGGTAREYAACFSVDGKGYVGTGYDGSYKKDFWEYDPITNLWLQKADFGGTARHGSTGFSIGSKGYVGTGRDVNFSNFDFWEYDPSVNIWVQKADLGPTGRYSAVGFSIGGKGYIGTGTDGIHTRKDFWEFTPAGGGFGSWVQKADFGGSYRFSAIGFAIGNIGYIGTGDDVNNINDFWEYNPISNLWTKDANFGGGNRKAAVGFSIGNKGYIATGSDISDKKDFWEFNTEPIIGKEYAETMPINATKYINYDWTLENNKLYPSREDANVLLKYNNYLEFGIGLIKESHAGKIGYQTFSNSLDIVGAGTSYPNRRIKVFDRLYFDNILENRKLVLWETANNAHQFFGFGIEGGTLRYQVAGAGNVHRFYAGTGASTSKLLFTIYDSGDVTAERDAYAVVNMFAQGFYPTSDRKLKKNIVKSTNSLINISKLNGYNYNWIDENYPSLQTGLIAQEVQEIYPHLVVKNKDGNLTVNYNALVPELIEAIKELKEKNETLEKSLADFKAQVLKEIDLLRSKNK